MSFIVYLAAVGDAAADRLVAQPDEFQAFMLGGPLVFETREERTAYYSQAILPKSLKNATRPETVDMDKAWAAIDHLLSKHGNPILRFITRGGRAMRGRRGKKPGPEIARVFSAAEVAEIHTAIDAISDDDMRAWFDPSELTASQVYPDIWDEHGLDYILPWFGKLKQFVQERAQQGEGFLVSAG